MGDAQSAVLKDAAAAEESGEVEDAQTEHNTEDKPLKNNGQISEIDPKADSSKAEFNGHCEDEITAEAVLSPDEDVSQTDSPIEVEANEDVPLEMTELDAKQNDINESFRRFFINIGLKLTVKRGSGEIPTDVPNDTNKEEPDKPEDLEDTTKETTSENAEQNTDMNIAQETYDNDSTTCPTLTDVTSEDVLDNAEEKATETKVEVESDNADAAMTSPVGEDAHQDATTEEEPRSTSPSIPEEVSPIKRFFTTGIFSGLRKKKKPAEDEITDKEIEDIGEKQVVEKTEQTVQDQQQDKEDISLGVEAAAVETEHEENELKGETLSAAQTMDASTDPSTIIVTEPEVLSSQEKDKIQASPLKRLLSGSSLKKLSKKQRGRKSSDAKLSDSGEHVSDQRLSSTESVENQKEEGRAQPPTETAEEEDSVWVSFKRLLTPKKRIKKSSLSNEETQIPGSVEEPKPSERGQISDHSTEEGKKRKDSSVSWESVLCRSGRRRSRKTSDSEEETPQIDNDINKQDGGSKHATESAQENEDDEILAYSPKQAGSPSEGDGASTWKSLKRLVTPKRKAKDDDESKENVQSDSEITQDESSFSIKKLLPGRKTRKSAEKQDQVSSDEADKEAVSGDEDSDTPAVVPLSEFDTVETEVQIQTQAEVESHIPKEADFELQQDLLDQMAEPVLPCDNLQTEEKKVQGNDDALENQATTTPATNEKPDDLTESIGKPQLSDIPEEATPASVTEEAARDDTIAEDLIEITSEAITAQEPSDNTLADETEMISAVSQLTSESSKTSGNTTPVPAEYVVEETDVLLYQVVETISMNQEAVPVCSDELRSERKVVSVSHKTLGTFVKEEPKILELHRSFDATKINTGLKVGELDANNELAATTQIESIFESNDSVSTETTSEVPTEEFDTAETAEDEVQEVDVTHPEVSLTELESIDEGHYLVECLSEVNVAGSTNKLPEGDEIVPDKGDLVEAHQTETEPPKLDSQEADSAATVANETKDEAMEQEVQSLTNKEDQIMHNITDWIKAEDDDQQPIEVEDLQELADVQALTLGSEKGSVSSLKKDIIPEGIPEGETVTDELKEVLLTEVSAEPEKEDELETDDAKPEPVQEQEASEAEQVSSLDSKVGSVQSPKEEVKSKDIPPADTVTDEPNQKSNLEPVDISKTEHVEEPEVLQAVKAPTLDSQEGSVQSPKEEVNSEDIPPAETMPDKPNQTAEGLNEVSVEPENKELPVNVMKTLDSEEGSVQSLEKEMISEIVPERETDEPKEETLPLTKDNLEPVDAHKTKHVQELQASEAVQAPTLDSEDGGVQTPKEELKSGDILTAGETVTDEYNQTAEGLTEVSVEPENQELPVYPMKTLQQPEVSEDVQAPILDSEEGIVQILEKEVISENVPERETDEPKEETLPLTEDNLEPVDAHKTKHAQELQASEAVQAPTLDSEDGGVQTPKEELKSGDILTAGETVKDEYNQTAEGLTEVSVEPENQELPVYPMKTLQQPEVSEDVQAPILDSEEGIVQILEKEVISENVPERETDEPKEETLPLTEDNLEPVDAHKTKHVQELQASEAVQAPTLDSEDGGVQTPKEELKSGDILTAGETVTDEYNQTAEGLTEVSVEPENQELPVYPMKTLQQPEVSEDVQAPILDSEEGIVQILEKEVISENVPERETDEPKEETLPLTEDNLVPVGAAKTEHVQEPQASEAVQAPTLDSEDGGVQTPKEELKSGDILTAGETVTDEYNQTAEGLTEVSVEPENQELPVYPMKTLQQPEVSEDVQAPILDSEEGIVQILEKEVISENVPERETDEPKEETLPLTEDNLVPVGAAKTEHVQELQASEVVQAPTLDSEDGGVQTPKEELKSGDILTAGETVTDEYNQTAEGLTEVSVEPENQELPVYPMKTLQQPEVSEDVQAPILDSEEGIVQILEKEVISENVPERETDEPKEETLPLTEDNLVPVGAAKTEHVQELQASEVVQAPTLDSEDGGVQSPKEEVKSEDIPTVETVTDEPKQLAEVLNEVSVKLENKELPANYMKTVQEPEVSEAVPAPTLVSEEGSVQSLENEVISERETDEPKEETKPLSEDNLEPVDADKTEHVQELQASEAVQAPTLDSEEGIVQPLEKEVISQNVPEEGTVTDEPKQTAEHLTEVSVESADDSKTEQVQEPEVVQSVPAPTLDSEEGSVQSHEKEVISEDVPEGETVNDEQKEETICLTEINLEPVDASKTEHVQEPDVQQAEQAATLDPKAGSLLSVEKEVISVDIPAVETVTDEPQQENEEKLSVEAAKTGHAQEPEVLPSDVKDHVTETNTDEKTSMCVHVVTQSVEGGSAQEFEKQILLDDIPKPNFDSGIASVTDGPKGEGVAHLGLSLEIAEDQKTASITQDVKGEQEDCIPEVIDELQTLTAVCELSANEEASNVQVLEKIVLSEETPCVDNAAVTNEPKHEVRLSAVQVGFEGEKESEFPGTEVKTAAAERAVVAQVVICDIKDISVAIPDVLIEKTSPSTEPLIDRLTSEQVFKEEVETATPLVRDDKAETAEEGSVGVMMHVPSVESQMINDDDIKSAETIVDTLLEVEITEAKEVIDVCHLEVKKVDNLSATLEIEEELTNEETKVTIQEVIQHVNEKLPETAPESVVVNLEQEGTKQPDAVTDVSEMVEGESKVVEEQKEMDDSNASFLEREDEMSTITSDVAATGQQVTEALMHTPDSTPCLDVSIHDQKDGLEETKAEREKSEEGVEEEEVKSNQMIDKESQTIQTPIGTPPNAELVAPQNTGIILSKGSMESPPSSHSIEFKLIIQFGQTNEPDSPTTTTERSEPVKKTDVSEVGVQTVEVVEPVKTIKQIDLTKVAVQATETTELAANLDSMDTVVITTQPVIQAMEPEEQIQSSERVTSRVQTSETIQPVSQTEKIEESPSQPGLSEACEQETKAEEPVKRKEEDQKVWMDAEEDIYSQEETEVSILEGKESLEPPTESEQEEKARLEHEVEMVHNSKTEEEESQQEMHKTEEKCETDSKGEDFAVALEHPGTETVSVTTME